MSGLTGSAILWAPGEEMVLGSQSISEHETSQDARASALVEALEGSASGLQRRTFVGIHASHAKDGDVEAALDGTYRIGKVRHELRPPVDWSDRPYGEGDEAAFRLNCFFFADPVVLAEVPEEVRRVSDSVTRRPVRGLDPAEPAGRSSDPA